MLTHPLLKCNICSCFHLSKRHNHAARCSTLNNQYLAGIITNSYGPTNSVEDVTVERWCSTVVSSPWFQDECINCLFTACLSVLDLFTRPYYDIGVLGTSMLYRIANSIFAFTPQVGSFLFVFQIIFAWSHFKSKRFACMLLIDSFPLIVHGLPAVLPVSGQWIPCWQSEVSGGVFRSQLEDVRKTNFDIHYHKRYAW